MPLSPETVSLLEMFQTAGAGSQPADIAFIDALRASSSGATALMQPADEVRETHDIVVDGPDDNPIPVRVYRPTSGDHLPTILYLHGGGFSTYNIDIADPISRRLATRSNAVVVAADYRKAPEHPYPAGLEDSFAVLTWVAEHADQYGGDPHQIVVAGDSSGANFAAVLTHLVRRRNGPKIQLQVLVNPVVDADLTTDSWQRLGGGQYLLSRDLMAAFLNMYLNNNDPKDPNVSPLRAPFFGRLPAAYIAIPEYDPLRDSAEAYGRRLKAAAIPVTTKVYKGQIHGFWWMGAAIPESDELFDDIAAAIHGHFASGCPALR